MYYDVSQDIQDKRLENIDKKIGNIAETVDGSQSDGVVSELGSVKSHMYGKTLNLIHNPNETYTIPINNGCLFVVNNENGEVDYDVTNFARNDKNKPCCCSDDISANASKSFCDSSIFPEKIMSAIVFTHKSPRLC
jgi:hypothetical protein